MATCRFFDLLAFPMPKTRKVIISVISDLVTDQRVHRTALSLNSKGLEVTLVGRKMRNSAEIEQRPYRVKRFKLPFEKGPLFYASYNIRLFFYLLFHRADVLVTNDLDTLLPNFIISRLKGSAIYYDSHEYFTEVPELISRPGVRKIWLSIEQFIFPKLKNVYTVNDSIAGIYKEKYNVDVKVIRNLPIRGKMEVPTLRRADFGLPSDKTIFLFQGAGINVDRGAEEAIEAIAQVPNAALLFIGGGDVIQQLQQKVAAMKVNDNVYFIPKQPMEKLLAFTQLADIGLTLDKDTNLNYRYSLPNKLFDYIRAGLPVLATDLVEVRKIVDGYSIGKITNSCLPNDIASAMEAMIADRKSFALWKENLKIASLELCWEEEEKKLMEIFHEVI
jgi:glycosyltransferase involved in cell wall biosynthesis